MSKFGVVMFPNEETIPKATRVLRDMHGGDGIKLYASTAVARDPQGKLSVQEITKEGHGGAAAGALIGALAGLLAGPLAAAIMAAGGALIGNAANLDVQSDFAEFAGNVAGTISPGSAVIVAEVDNDSVSTFEGLMQGLG